MTFRQILFWIHFTAGVVCGLAIGLMCLTGTVLAFEKDLVAWAERDARRIDPASMGAPRLTLDEMQQRLRNARPDARPASIVIQNDPQAAVAFVAGRTGFYVNPYTGEIRQPESQSLGGFMQRMIELHRYLGFSGTESRPRGKLINGIANLAFCVLGFTGLYLWMPRSWSWRSLRPVIWFRQNSSGRARDFNWHNTIGFWSAPVLIALTLTAMPISFRWAGSLLYTLTGNELPATGPQSSGAPPPAAPVPEPPAGATAVARAVLLADVQRELPDWQSITLRFAGPGPGQSESFTVRENATWPRTATTTLQYDPFTGKLLRRDGYEDLNGARKLRAWTRYLHTGEAVGMIGQFLAGLASLGGVFLVGTGLALAWRRVFGRTSETAGSRGGTGQ